MIGYFINMLVLKPEFPRQSTLLEVAHAVKATVLDAFEHQDLTLDQVVHAVNPPRDTSRHPLFQAMFVLHNNVPLPTGGMGVRFEPYAEAPVQSSYFELNLALQETANGYDGRMVYNKDLFKEETIQRLLSSMRCMLKHIVASPSEPWSEVTVADSNQQTLIRKFSSPQQEQLRIEHCRRTLDCEFDRIAAMWPNKTALVDGDHEYTYSNLCELADAYARKLQAHGVKPRDIVATMIPRSAEAIVAILGIMKAGAAYMPLDEKSPASRNRSSLKDSRAKYLIAPALANEWRDLELIHISSGNIDCLLEDAAEIPTDQTNNTLRDLEVERSEDSAYVIYTSGSTGEPKGVVIPHRAAIAYVDAARSNYDVRSTDRLLQFSSLSFDAHVEELYLALLTGATLVLRDEAMLDSVNGFLDACEKHDISVLSLSTGFWHEISLETAETHRQMPTSIRTIIFGGEAVAIERVKDWFETHGTRITLINSYGPTETTVVATSTVLTPEDCKNERLAIGRPLPTH